MTTRIISAPNPMIAIATDPKTGLTAQYRPFFPLLDRCVYLDSNTAGAVPRAARLAVDEYWDAFDEWRDDASTRWSNALADYAADLAALMNAAPRSIVCGTDTSALLTRMTSGLDLRARPVIVTSDLEPSATMSALSALGGHGAELDVVPSANGIEIDGAQIARAIDERTQLVLVSHVTHATGALLNVAPIVRRAREVGALVALDVQHSVGAVPVDVTLLGVDFAFAGAHTWLCGSVGSAFLYVRPSSSHPSGHAQRFADGTLAVLPVLMSQPGLAIVRAIGVQAISALSLARTDHIIERADEAGLGVATPRPHHRRGGMVALRFPGDADVARKLNAAGFACSYRGGIRVAPHFYNTDEEIDRFMDALVRATRRLE